MESPKPVSRYIAQSSNKRVFPGGSSSSGFEDVEVLEISPPTSNRTSRTKSSKQKEKVIYHDIIDVDIEEDCGDTDRSRKAKKVICHEIIDVDMEEDHGTSDRSRKHKDNFSAGVTNLASDGSRSEIKMSKNGTVEDFNSNLFYGQEDWIDKYFDDIEFEESDLLESQFDHMDIPSGVEAPFPWLPGGPQNNIKVPKTGTSTSSSSKIEWNGGLHSSDSLLLSKPFQNGNLMTSSSPKQSEAGSGLKRSTTSRSKGHLSSKPSSGGSVPHNPGKSKRSHHASPVYSSPHNQFPSGLIVNYSGYPTLSVPYGAPGIGTYTPVSPGFLSNILEPSTGPSVFMGENAIGPLVPDSAKNQNGATSATAGQRNADENPQNFDHFKKFDTVEDYSDHHYSKSASTAKQAQKNWAKRIQEEWKILEKDLPDTIFVRVYESRMDLLRAVIVGAEGTPYHDGLFFFDVYFPSSYPDVPPKVHYHSGGLRINPNLYNCGKVCLSLLNTWSGGHKEKWIPGVSTMLQVLVSIQGLILNVKPYFNEPGYESTRGSLSGEKNSSDYNETTFIYSLQTMVYTMRRPPKYFEAFVVDYFCKHAQDILKSCKAYLEGVQVGCRVKGGNSCSQHFRSKLAGFIATLVNTFTQIGAKDCQEFLSLSSHKANAPATAAIMPPNFYY